MIIEHNSWESFYRSPFGAIEVDSNITLRLAIREGDIPTHIKLIYKQEEGVEEFVYMNYIYSVCGTSIYESSIKMPSSPTLVWYYFEIKYNDITYYYGNNQSHKGGIGKLYEDECKSFYQITVYKKNYKTPDWFKKSIAYQIFPDRFFNPTGEFLSDRTDIIKRTWGDTPFYKKEQFGGKYLCNDFYGGTLNGITQKLPYLNELGISVIYLNPIFEAYSNHKYDTGNYENIDPSFGNEEDFINLCNEANKYNIRIILDGVFNHTGSNSKYFNKDNKYDSIGAYGSKESPYYNWYSFEEYPNKYESWWGIDTLPQVNELNSDYQDYILKNKDAIIKKWLRLGASGWRLDVADELPDEFIEVLKAEASKQKKDSVIIGEVWEDASNKIAYDKRRKYFYGDELDSVMNYPLKDALISFVTNKITPYELLSTIMSLKENYPRENFYSLLNILSGHDIERVATLIGDAPNKDLITKDEQATYYLDDTALNKAKLRLQIITVLQMTLPGVPCIFYGDEILTQGYGDPFCRSCFDWDRVENNKTLDFYKQIIALRNSSLAFSIGEFIPLYYHNNTICYMRSYNNERYLVLVNSGFESDNIRIDIAKYNINSITDTFSNETIISDNGVYLIGIGHIGYRIFKL